MAKRTRKAKAPKTAPKRAGGAFSLQHAAEWATAIREQIPAGEVCDIQRDLIWKHLDEFERVRPQTTAAVAATMGGTRVGKMAIRSLWNFGLMMLRSIDQGGPSKCAKWRQQSEIPWKVVGAIQQVGELLSLGVEITRADLAAVPTKGVREVLECWRVDTEWSGATLGLAAIRLRLRLSRRLVLSDAAVRKRTRAARKAGWVDEVLSPKRGFVITEAGKVAWGR